MHDKVIMCSTKSKDIILYDTAKTYMYTHVAFNGGFSSFKTHLLLFEHTLASCVSPHLRQGSRMWAVNQPGQTNTHPGKHALRTSYNDSATKNVPCD